MKRFYSLAIIFLSMSIGYGQEFLTSFDYVYGCASSENEYEADSLALLSFAKCLNVKINNTSSYLFEETKAGVNESYKNNVSVTSNADVSGLRKYVDYDFGIYTVYYYFNKQEYIDRCLSEYKENIALSNKFKDSKCFHAENLYIGYLYLAYLAVSDSMLLSVYPQAKHLKGMLCAEIKTAYSQLWYFLSSRNVGNINPSGINMIRDENSRTLPGFEYKNTDGEWIVPTEFCDEECELCEQTEAKWAYVYNSTKEYRFLFETETELGIRKINVPDEFYRAYTEEKKFVYLQ